MTQLTPPAAPIRRLVVVLGDQLDPDSAALDAFDPARDLILMCEAVEEARYVAQHKKRLILFFTAMRLFAAAERARGRAVRYHALDDPGAPETLAGALEAAVAAHAPQEVVLVTPGDWRVLTALRAAAERAGAALSLAADRRFLADKALFDRLASGRKRFILEDFYRGMRRETGWLLTPEG
ncbi:MAG: cryptochrome/photolyase family protein, partial [Pseudomonadota bacterium]